MKFTTAVVAAVAFTGSALADSSVAKVTPVQKVVQLLEGMMEKGKKDKHDEQVQFAAYKQFCQDTARDKTNAIKAANERIDTLKADIEKYTVDAARLGKEIAAHDEDISVWKGDTAAVNKVHEMETNDYNAMHKDYSESVDALQRAIAVLKEQAYNRKQAASFAQVKELTQISLIPASAKKVIDSFLQAYQSPADEGLAVSAPEAYGYEFQSRGIIEILEKLLDKFIDERTALEKEEMNRVGAYDLMTQDLKNDISYAEQKRAEKAATKAKTLQAKADAEGDLQDTTTTRDADQVYLDDLVATCETKATDFESRQTLRIQEMEAINKAIEIISGEPVTGNADKYLPTLLQVKESSMAQVRSDEHSPAQSRAVSLLNIQAKKLHSKVLSAMAEQAASQPFQKVIKMIKDLITRLMEEATEETEHKGWCDTELSTNEQTRVEKTQAVEMLHAEIDMLEASITKLGEDIDALTEALAELEAAMLKATKFREAEHAENMQTIEDAKEAQVAVAQALTVLREFYAKAGEATALLQQQPVAPEIFDSPYKGMQAENGGVVGMLEVIQSDFARLESDTSAAEAAAQKQYEQFMEDSRIDKVQKEGDIKHKTAKKQDEEQALVSKKASVEGTQKELDAALSYFDKLKPSCIDAGVSYDDRVARRQAEIESLQTALRILNGEDIA